MLKEPEPTERIYNVSEVRIHYNYSLGETISVNDVALLKLSEKVNYTQEIRPACLPKANEREKVGTKCTLTGKTIRSLVQLTPIFKYFLVITIE